MKKVSPDPNLTIPQILEEELIDTTTKKDVEDELTVTIPKKNLKEYNFRKRRNPPLSSFRQSHQRSILG